MKRLSITTLAVLSLAIAVAGCGSTATKPSEPKGGESAKIVASKATPAATTTPTETTASARSDTVQAEEMILAEHNGWSLGQLELMEKDGDQEGGSKEQSICISLYDAARVTPAQAYASPMSSETHRIGEEAGVACAN